MSESTALTIAQRAVVALGITEEKKTQLRELAARTTDIVTITNADGYKQVHAARMALKNERLELEKDGKAAREEATAFSKKVIELEKEAIGIIQPEEIRLQAIQKAHDDAIEAEKEAKIAAELARTSEINRRIEMIRAWPTNAAGKPSSLVAQQLATATGFTIGEEFAEFADTAKTVLEASRLALVGILSERKATEEEQARVIAERAELEKLRAEQAERDRLAREAAAVEAAKVAAAQKAEQDRLDGERRELEKQQRDAQAKIDAERKAEADRIEGERRALAKQQADAKAVQEAEEARIAADRKKLADDQEAARIAALPKPKTPKEKRPTDADMIGVLALHYRVHESKVVEWILQMDLSNPELVKP